MEESRSVRFETGGIYSIILGETNDPEVYVLYIYIQNICEIYTHLHTDTESKGYTWMPALTIT